MATTMIEDSTHFQFNRAYTFKGKCFTSLTTPSLGVLDPSKTLLSATTAVKRLFDDGVLDPDQQYDIDESHFIIDLDDGKTMDFRGADKVKYCSIVS
ncbi:hypothetical protein PHMEG_00040066, partial [Phytophthora megakarya]